jgi:regulator of sigma E protease
LFNILFAIFALWIVNWSAGIQHAPPVVGPMAESGPAMSAGIRPDDLVTEIGGRPVRYFSDISEAMDQSDGRALTLTVSRQGRIHNFSVKPVRKTWDTPLGDTVSGWVLGFDQRTRPVIGEVLSGKAAAEAGVREGDLIVSINSVPTPDWVDVMAGIRQPDRTSEIDGETVHSEPQPLAFVIDRQGEILRLNITPALEPSYGTDGGTIFVPIVGFSPKLEILREPLGPIRAFQQGLTETWVVAKLTAQTFIRLFQAKISVKVLGGPLMIAEVAGIKARAGLQDFIWVMALISLNLAIINLVPIPVLDGGQLLFFGIEGLRRKPLSLRFREACQWAGITAMVALMILVFYNDIHRLVTRLSGPSVTQQEAIE